MIGTHQMLQLTRAALRQAWADFNRSRSAKDWERVQFIEKQVKRLEAEIDGNR